MLFFNFFTLASSNTWAESKKTSPVKMIKSEENKAIDKHDEGETDIHPLCILDFRFK